MGVSRESLLRFPFSGPVIMRRGDTRPARGCAGGQARGSASEAFAPPDMAMAAAAAAVLVRAHDWLQGVRERESRECQHPSFYELKIERLAEYGRCSKDDPARSELESTGCEQGPAAASPPVAARAAWVAGHAAAAAYC